MSALGITSLGTAILGLLGAVGGRGSDRAAGQFAALHSAPGASSVDLGSPYAEIAGWKGQELLSGIGGFELGARTGVPLSQVAVTPWSDGGGTGAVGGTGQTELEDLIERYMPGLLDTIDGASDVLAADETPGGEDSPVGQPVPVPSVNLAPAPKPSASHAALGADRGESTTAGTGPNAIVVKNSFDHPITLGQFANGGSTTVPVASVTLQPGQSGVLRHENGTGGVITKADSTGTFKPSASRLEYFSDADGKMSWVNGSYIDGRNAAIAFTDGGQLTKGDRAAIAGDAPAGIVTRDAAGEPTITGWYDGSTAAMQQGGAFMEAKLGTAGAYLHPDDDRRASGQNPMSGTTSKLVSAEFGPA